MSGAGSGQQNAIYSSADGAATASWNRGIVATASNNSNENYGGWFSAGGNAGTQYGIIARTSGTQANTMYAAYLSSNGSGTGVDYGIYSVGEDRNYFSNNVWIGTTTAGTANNKLYVQRSSTSVESMMVLSETSTGDASMRFYTGNHWSVGSDNSDADKFKISDNINLGVSDRFTIDASTGYIGMNQNNPSQRLDVNGNITAQDFYGNLSNGVINCGGGVMSATINYIGDNYVAPTNVNGDEDLYIADDIQVNSQAYKPGGGSWVATSDRRLKRDINPYTTGLNELLQVRTVSYKYIDRMNVKEEDNHFVGVIAQDLMQVSPEMVNETKMWQEVREDENGNEIIVKEGESFYTVDPSNFTYMTINAVQEQQTQIEKLKSENAALKEKFDQQQAEIDELKRLIQNK